MKRQDVKVVILCGGRGARLKEETEFRPKPLVEVGERPILWHIMKIYAHYGFKDFILCLGYKGEMIKEYFLNYEATNNDFTISLGKPNVIQFHSGHLEHDWNITLVNTGIDAQTGARIKKIEKYIDGDTFMLTYGDGVINLNIKKLLKFHEMHKKTGTMTGVHPSSRFGELLMKDNHIVEFTEKPQVKEGLINGGFFIFKRKFFNYLTEDDGCYLEGKALEKLAAESELLVYPHDGFWQCVDTYRELELLNNLWRSPNPPWKAWQ